MSLPIAPVKRESGDDRKLAIALAARDLIVEKGLEGLRTRDIAQRVGINIATLHYHVPSKEALIELVTATMVGEFRVQSLNRPRAHLSPAERLEHEFFDFHEMFTQHRDVLAVMSELMERARRDETIRAIIQPVQAKWRDMVAAIFEAGVDDGSFRADLDPEVAALVQIGALIAFCRGLDTSPAYFDRLCAELRRAVANPLPPKD
ncbi:MAG TPA: TetR/AcrR family transcriptional regulator [Devosia sp.]|nr:TetR/AcrR family transcriptional regulator [Devosia sp.]